MRNILVIGLVLVLAASASAAVYRTLVDYDDLRPGLAALDFTDNLYIDGSDMYAVIRGGDSAIVKVSDLDGAQSTSVLVDETTIFFTLGTKITSYYGMEKYGDDLIFSTVGQAGLPGSHGVIKVNTTTTNDISIYASRSSLQAHLVSEDPGFSVDPKIGAYHTVNTDTGEFIVYEFESDKIVATTGANAWTTLVTPDQLQAMQGDTTLGSAMVYSSGKLYWGDTTNPAIYCWDIAAGSGYAVIPGAVIMAMTGEASVSFSEAIVGGDGWIYFFERTADSILRFNPAAVNPAATLEVVLSGTQLAAGSYGSTNVWHMGWFDGAIAFSDWKTDVCAAPVAQASSDLAAVSYKVINLRLLAGPDRMQALTAYGINDYSQVTGHGWDPCDPCNWRAHPFFADYKNDFYSALPNLDGVFDPCAGGNGYRINEAGWVVGRNENSSTDYHGFMWLDDNGNGAYDPCEMRDLTPLPGYDSGVARELNNRGQVVGTDSYWDGSSSTTISWIWDDVNGDTRLDAGEKVGVSNYIIHDINDAGVMGVSDNSNVDGYVWYDDDDDKVVDVGELTTIPNVVEYAGDEVRPYYVNNRGQVAGRAENLLSSGQGFLWTDANGDRVAQTEEFETFGSLLKETHLRDMNDAAEIVGGTYAFEVPSGFRQAFIWDAVNGMRNLNDLLIPQNLPGHGPFMVSQAEGINNRGQIVASGWYDDDGDGKKDSNEASYAAVLTPVFYTSRDLSDFAVLSDCYGATAVGGTACEVADLNGDDDVDFDDLIVLINYWLMSATDF